MFAKKKLLHPRYSSLFTGVFLEWNEVTIKIAVVIAFVFVCAGQDSFLSLQINDVHKSL